MRLFIAVNLDEDLRKKIIPLVESFVKTGADVKWVKPENLHLTLKFLGEVKEDKVPTIEQVLTPLFANFGQFKVEFFGFGVFPNLSSPRVIWMGINQGKNELKELSEKIENSLVSLGFPKEKREFTAHLTLGRIRTLKGKESLVRKIEENLTTEVGLQEVKKIYLMQSSLHPTGPTYKTVKEWNLKQIEKV